MMAHPQPSLWEKATLGFIMGSTVGGCLGCLTGIYSTMKFGPGPRGYLGTIGQYALGSGAMFGFFMSIGSCIRNDDSGLSSQDREALDRKYNAAFALSSRRPRPIASYIDYRTSPPTQ